MVLIPGWWPGRNGILAKMYFAGGANRRYGRWDVAARQSKATDLPRVLGLAVIPGMRHGRLRTERTQEDHCSNAQSPSHVRLCDPMDYSPPGSSVHGILQARILAWVAISSLRGSSQPRDQTHVSCISCIAGGFFTTEALRNPRLAHTTTPK